jgi:hypothetical protein
MVDQHALEWSPTMDGGGRPPWMVVAAHHGWWWPPTMDGNVTNISQKEASQKLCPIVIARRNDEAIRLFSGISGLLHSVRNDEICTLF